MVELSVIIPTYNGKDLVENCLNSILEYNDIGDELEVIVSDNSPTRELVDFINKKYKFVKTCKNDNIGFGGACNRGYELSNGKYILFLNPDTILVESVFRFAINKFETDKELALFGVQLLNVDYTRGFSFGLMDIYSLFRSWRNKSLVKHNSFRDKKMFISGADMFIRRSSFIQAGCFDENIFMFYEESDLIRRIKLKSETKKIAFFSDKKIIHLGGGTQGSDEGCVVRALKQTERIEASSYYYAQKYGLNYAKILKYRIATVKLKLLACKIRKAEVWQRELQEKLLIYYKQRLKNYRKQSIDA